MDPKVKSADIKFENTTNGEITKDPEILRKRREARQQNRHARAANWERIKRELKLNKPSQKLRVVSPEECEKIRSVAERSVTIPKCLKVKEQTHNLFDFVVNRKKQFSAIKRIEINTSLKRNRGKKREIRKTFHTSLKKKILWFRAQRNSKKMEDDNVLDLADQLTNLKVTDAPETSHLNQSNSVPLKIHSRTYRSYCDNTTTKALIDLTEQLLFHLFRFQKRAYEKNEIKAVAHRRYVVGFKEVQRQIVISKTKLVIIATDCESCDVPGGLEDIIAKIKMDCQEKNIPYMFGMRKRRLGYIFCKKVPVSCVGVLNYDGCQEIFEQLQKCIEVERKKYNYLVTNKNCAIKES